MRGAVYKLPRLMNNGYDSMDGLVPPMQQLPAPAWTDYGMCGPTTLAPSNISPHMVPTSAHVPSSHLAPVHTPWTSMYNVNNNTLAPNSDPGLSCAHMAPNNVTGPLSPYPSVSATTPISSQSSPTKSSPGKANRKPGAASKRRRGVGPGGRPSPRSPSGLLVTGDDTGTTGGVGTVPALGVGSATGGSAGNGVTPSGSHKSCVVCSDRAVNNNFGQITCESCKAFFRRNAHKMEKLNCTGKGRCQITTDSRKNCPRCRLEKCFHMGMRKELIQVRKKDGSAPKWLEGNSPDSGGSQAPPTLSMRPAQPRPLSVGSSTEGSPAVESAASHLPENPPPFHLSAPRAAPAAPTAPSASSPVASNVCISPAHPTDAWASLSPAQSNPVPPLPPVSSNGLAAMFTGNGPQYGNSELSSSLRIFRDLVGPNEEENMAPDAHPLLQQMEGLMSTLLDNFNYNHPVNLEPLTTEFESSWGLEFAVLVDVLLRQLIHFLRHNDVTKHDSMRQDIEAIKVGLMNALPIFLALNYDRASGNFRFTIDGQLHEVSGIRLESALASIDPPETDILRYLVRYNTSVAALLHHKRDLFGLYLLLKIMTPSEQMSDSTSYRCTSSHAMASWCGPGLQSTTETMPRFAYKDVYELLSRALRELNQTEANTLSEMLLWSQGFDKAFRKAFSMKLSAHHKDILPKLVSEFVIPELGSGGRRIASM